MLENRGFTLIEVIAAMTIIAIGLLSLLALFPTGIGLNQLSAGDTQGSIVCKSMMQEIKKAASSTKGPNGDPVRYEDLIDDGNDWYNFGKYLEPADDEERQVAPDNSSFEISVVFTDDYGPYIQGDGITRVIVTAYWPKAGSDPEAKSKQQSVKLVSFVRYYSDGAPPI